MNSENDKKSAEKKKLLKIVLASILALCIVTGLGFFVLSKIKKNDSDFGGAAQEQFVGQVETSQQLQSECQNSAFQISKSENLKLSIDEYKKRVENCKEVYFVIDEKTKFRNEGMYPDLAVDLLVQMYAENKEVAFDFLKYLKTISSWQFYMGPIVCDSQKVIAAYEESLTSQQEKVCLAAQDFNDKIFSELKNKNFAILEKITTATHVAWLGSPESDAGCPEKLSNIIKTATRLTEGAIEVNTTENLSETKEIGIVFRNKSEEDKLVLEFDEVDGCFQLKSALVAGFDSEE